MQKSKYLKSFVFIQSGLFLLLLLLLLIFKEGPVLFYGGISLTLLIGYHLVIDYRFTTDRIASAGLMPVYIVLYLLLCTLVAWTTRGHEESPFWIVYFLPIIIAAANLSLKGTFVTCIVALVLFISHLPPQMYLEATERFKELPELLGFGIMFFLVGALVQNFAAQHRRQLESQQLLNEKLLDNQQRLKDSLTRLERAEENLRTKERLASLGEMSAGIAHEIRNPLGIISSSAQMLENEIANADARQLLDIIQEESTRLNGLITDFLTFGRQLKPQLQQCDLSLLVGKTLDALRLAADQQEVRLQYTADCTDCTALADPDMMQQVLLNLVLNALEATPPEGLIEITLEQKGDCLDIGVRDNGCGISAENLGKVFDPFFTTRSNGTGLGLANAYKIMEGHGGMLAVESQVGEGSLFTVTLPSEKT